MKAKAVEIRWHNTKSIYSADFQPSVPSNLSTLLAKKAAHPYALSDEEKKREALASERGKVWRLATAGGDNMVMTWLVHPDPGLTLPSAIPKTDGSEAQEATAKGAPAVEYLATLAKHQGVVNVVRFCPKGEVLASAGDDGNVLLWVLSSGQGATVFGETAEDRQYEREAWRTRLMLRGPGQCEIYDIAWSPCGDFLVSGDTAKQARIWNATDGQCIKQIQEHSNFVQGVAWDPLGQYIATQSSDRSLHIYTIQIQKDPSGAATADVQHVGKHAKMDVLSNPGGGGSWSPAVTASPAAGPTSQLPPATSPLPIRPVLNRSMSMTSDVSLRSESSSALAANASLAGHQHRPPSTSSASASLAPPTPSTSTMQPPSEIPHHPHHTHTHVSNPSTSTSAASSLVNSLGGGPSSVMPARSHSRQSSSSTHASPALSASRVARSPSPAPPLPAVNVEAEHHRAGSRGSGGGGGGGVPLISGPADVSASEAGGGAGTREKGTVKLYGDEGASAFFRRLEFSIDGALLVSPAGRWEDPWTSLPTAPPSVAPAAPAGPAATVNGTSSGKKKRKADLDGEPARSGAAGEKHTVYIYGRAGMSAGRPPLAHLPGHKTSSVAVRFSPIAYRLRHVGPSAKIRATPAEVTLEKGKSVEVKLSAEPSPEAREVPETEDDDPAATNAAVFSLPYRMVYAVATHDAVFLYDTQQASPLCILGNLHYASFTDLAWTADGETLVLSSSDGYCSLVVFDPEELGDPTPLPAPPASASASHHHHHHHRHHHHHSPSAAGQGSIVTAMAKAASSSGTARPSPPTAAAAAAAANGQAAAPPADAPPAGEEDGAAKKKRRVALTYEGPTLS